MISKSTIVNITSALCAFVIVLAFAPGAAAQPSGPTITWAPFTLEVSGVGAVEVQQGHLRVPEQRSRPDGNTIQLGFVRLAAKTPRHAPVVYLDGGPGGDGYGIARVPAYYRLFDRLRAERDVILLSQRGVGLSRPGVGCPGPNDLPDDFLVSRQTIQQAMMPSLIKCAEQLRGQGVDLGAYNTRESADDIEDLRRALGVPTISLLGFSYGTHLGLEVLRRHPGSVDRAVLIGTEGPWHTLKLPREWDQQFARLAKAAQGVTPDLIGQWRALLARAAAAPIELPVEIGGRPRTLLVGAEGLQWIIRRDLGDTNDWPWIPITIVAALEGNLEGLQRVVPRRFSQMDRGVGLMAFAMDCASGASAERLATIRAQAADALLGPMSDYPFPDVCQALGVPMLPDDFRTPFASTVPTLFVSGTNDGNTPPAQAEAVAAQFTRATHLVVEDAGHESSMPDPAVQDAIARFLDGGRVEGLKLRVPLQPFMGARR